MEAQRRADAPYPLKFEHRHSFFVTNLWEVISVEIENFQASEGVKTGRQQIFLWGSYNLVISYLKYYQKEKKLMTKLLTKVFSCILPSAPWELKRKQNLICEAKCTYMITPVFLCLLPLLRKINLIPFKVTLLVQGEINDKVKKVEETIIKKEEPQKEQKTLTQQEKGQAAGKASPPRPHPQYYKTYRLFYEHFYKNKKG